MIPQHSKIKTPRSEKYLKWITKQKCVICGHKKEEYRDVIYAHQSLDGRGTAIKANDYHALPLCTFCHAEEGYKGVKTFWKDFNKEKLVRDHMEKYIKELDLNN